MNFKQVKWKTVPCHSGKECWCRMIVTEAYDANSPDPSLNDDFIVVGAAAIGTDVAKHLVKLHNNSLKPDAETMLRKSLNSSKMIKS